jgi:2-polyprenyl-3-methyl-5-hydroxy-6-metoxy-1,4-benzoquinol methylase
MLAIRQRIIQEDVERKGSTTTLDVGCTQGALMAETG